MNRSANSKHVFLFPFRWDFKEKDKDECQDNLSIRLNSSIFKIFLEKSNWRKSEYSNNEPLEYYNDATYFYEYVRTAIYQTSNNTNTVYNYEYILTSKTTYEITIETTESKKEHDSGDEKKILTIYELDVKKIMLNVYESGVGILSFHLLNSLYENKEDVLRINDYGRRIYPQFLDTSASVLVNPEGILILARNAFLAKQIRIFSVTKTSEVEIFKEDFSRFIDSDGIIKHIQNNPTKLPNSPYKIAKLLGESFTTIDEICDKEQIVIRPIIDDRMFVICWYANNEEISKLQYSSATNEYGFISHDKNDFWTKYIFIDNSGNTIQSKNLRKCLSKKHTYDRWIDWGTLYGISRYSLVALTTKDDFPVNVLSNHIVGRYYEMTQLALAQRASVIKFSDEATAIAGAPDNLLISEAEFLHKAYMQFINRMNFSEVTAQEQGIEMYEMLINSMEISKETNNLNREIDELHEFINSKEQDKATKEQDKATKEALWLNILATIFLPATFIVSFFGASFFSVDNLRLSFARRIDLYAISYSLLIIVFLVVMFFFYRKQILNRFKKKENIKSNV